MTRLWKTAATTGIAALLCVTSLDAGADEPLQLSAKTQRRLGLGVQTLKTVSVPKIEPATATVLDPVPFIHLDTDLQAAEATALASRQERDRLSSLQGEDSQVSAKALEAAQAQSAADAARVSGLRTELAIAWGTALARMSAAQSHALVESLARGTSALLRVDALGGALAAQGQQGTPDAVIVMNPATGKPVQSLLLGRWPQAGDNLRGSSWLVRVNAEGLATGQYTNASLASAAHTQGVLIPAEAVVRWNALQWVFVMVDATHFERRALGEAALYPQGWLASGDYRDGEQVVVRGAATLLSAQTLDVD